MFLFNFFRFKIILFLPSFLGLVNRLKTHSFGSCLDLETTFLSNSLLTSLSIVRVSSALNLSCLDIVCCGSSMNSNFKPFCTMSRIQGLLVISCQFLWCLIILPAINGEFFILTFSRPSSFSFGNGCPSGTPSGLCGGDTSFLNSVRIYLVLSNFLVDSTIFPLQISSTSSIRRPSL